MECKHCGAKVGIEYRLCPYCRSEMEYPTVNQQPNQPIIIQNIIQDTTADQNNPQNNYNQNYYQNNPQNYNANYPQNYPQNYAPNYFNNPVVSPKSKWLTLILAIFFGYFGIHRFYAGRFISGTLYIFTVGFFYIGWIFDIVTILTGNFKDGNGLPIKK